MLARFTLRIDLPTLALTAALGGELARTLQTGDLIVLTGPLGAGKTTLTRSLGAALGVIGTVTSPTFVIARTHHRPDNQPALVHVDAYRLGSAAELDDLDLDLAGSITVIEWGAGLVDGASESWLELELDVLPNDARVAWLSGYGPRWQYAPEFRELVAVGGVVRSVAPREPSHRRAEGGQ